MVHKHSENSRNRRDKPGYSWRVKKTVLTKLLRNNLKKSGTVIKTNTSQGKLKLYTSFKEHPGFENYLNDMNQTLNFARLSQKLGLVHINSQLKQVASKTKIKPTEYAHCADGIGNELHYLTECKNKTIKKNSF